LSEACSFRVATDDDIPAMSAIRLAVMENRLRDPSRITDAMYRDYLGRAGRGWVCERGGAIVGFSFAATGDASIWALFVSPAHEGLGVGTRLLALAVEFLFSLGHAQVVLSTGAGTRADRFYAGRGWTRCGGEGGDVKYALSRPAIIPKGM
jgi:GNAT superfamily N-acetyltransferase